MGLKKLASDKSAEALLNVKQMLQLSKFVALVETLKAKIGEAEAGKWLSSKAKELNDKVPAMLLKTEEGFQQVMDVVKSFRKKAAAKVGK